MQPGVVYTTFHHADTGANVVTTEYSDWATNCPEYKVTAVQVRLTNQTVGMAGALQRAATKRRARSRVAAAAAE